MAPFTRLFPFLQRFHFPPHGAPLNPAEVSDRVQLVHEIFRADLKHNLIVRSASPSGAGAGADINLNVIENPSNIGALSIPIWIAVAKDAAGNVDFQLQTVNSGETGPAAPPASWPLAFILSEYTLTVTGAFRPIAGCIPLMRGVHLGINFIGVPIGQTVRANGLWIEVPIDTIDWSAFASKTTGLLAY